MAARRADSVQAHRDRAALEPGLVGRRWRVERDAAASAARVPN